MPPRFFTLTRRWAVQSEEEGGGARREELRDDKGVRISHKEAVALQKTTDMFFQEQDSLDFAWLEEPNEVLVGELPPVKTPATKRAKRAKDKPTSR